MEKTVTKEKTVTMQVPAYTQLTCDVCGKLIYIIKDKNYIYHKGYYWEVAVGHHDWGNDSVDSYEYPDICSNECVKKFVDEYISKSNGELVFSSIGKYLPALRPYNELRTLPVNCLVCYGQNKLVKVKEYDRSKCQQYKKYTSTYYGGTEDDTVFSGYATSSFIHPDYLKYTYKSNNKPINGKFWLSRFGTIFKSKPTYANQAVEMCFFEGVPIPNEDAYNLIVKYCKKSSLDPEDFLILFENIIRYMSYDQIYIDENNKCVKATSPTTWVDFTGNHQFIGTSQIRNFHHGMMIDSKPCMGNYPDLTKFPKIDIKAIKKIWKPLI
jgi:hypothetical protein